VARNRENLRRSLVLLVGRPGLDPGTLGLNEGYEWSNLSGGVGFIRDLKKICPMVSEWSWEFTWDF